MGHLGHLKEEYQQLVRRLGAGPVGLPEGRTRESEEARREILEILYTPEEAALAAKMPVKPAGLGKVSAYVGMEPEALRPKLDEMADKGLVLDIVHPETGEVRYLLAPPVVGFFEFSLMRAKDHVPKKRIAEAMEAYCYGDEGFAQEVFGGDTVIGRALVHESALGDEALPEVLAWERATALVEDAQEIGVSLCYCRHKAEHLGHRCDAPMDNCLSLNGGASFVVRRGFGRRIDRVEALEILDEARGRGLVHIADNVLNQPTYICNCCGCCCGQLSAINRYDLPAVKPSRYEASPGGEGCSGCSKCAKACPVGAIHMEPRRVEGKRKAALAPVLDADRCIGCGVCAGVCRRGALTMTRRAEDPIVPVNAIDRTVRMCVERGRLADLVADEGANRGAAFLNQVIKGVCALPGAQRALAAEQLKSRFVWFAVRLVKDPTGSKPTASR